MSAIQEKLKLVKDQENKLRLDQCKVDFLNHILQSAKEYDHKDFAEVKEEVVKMLDGMVKAGIVSIENGTTVSFNVPLATDPGPPPTNTQDTKTDRVDTVKSKAAPGLSPHEQLNFALDNRHLSGKTVKVYGLNNEELGTGKVVGLDAPFVIVKTETGPTAKIPLDKIVVV